MPDWALLGRHHSFFPWAPSLVLSLLVEQQPYSVSGTFLPGKSVTMSAKTPPGSGIKWPGPKSRLSSLWKVVGLEQATWLF